MPGTQRAIGAILHHQIGDLVLEAKVMHPDDMAMLQVRDRARLAPASATAGNCQGIVPHSQPYSGSLQQEGCQHTQNQGTHSDHKILYIIAHPWSCRINVPRSRFSQRCPASLADGSIGSCLLVGGSLSTLRT